MLGQFSYIFLSCGTENSLMTNATFSLQSDCNENCFCDRVSFSPVCDKTSGTTFFSPCHAGCSKWSEKTKTFTDCICSKESIKSQLYRSSSTVASSTLGSLSTTTSSLPSTREKVLVFRSIDNIKEQKGENATIRNGEVPTTTPSEYNEYIEYDNDPALDPEYNSEEDGTHEQSTANPKKREVRLPEEIPAETSSSFMSPGSCGDNCMNAFYAFTGISLCINLLGATGKIGNILLNFR